jgi:hypothetical protein
MLEGSILDSSENMKVEQSTQAASPFCRYRGYATNGMRLHCISRAGSRTSRNQEAGDTNVVLKPFGLSCLLGGEAASQPHFGQLHGKRCDGYAVLFGECCSVCSVPNISASSNMSGIEVAGIVLAVLGTLIQGVGGYKEVITGRDVNLLVESLKDNKIMFSNSVEYLLRSVLPTEELATLLNDPKGNQWKDADLHERVISHLGQDAEAILQKIGDIYATLERLQRKLPVSLHLSCSNRNTS